MTLYLELKGLVDAAAELAKLEKEDANVRQQIEKLQKQMEDPNYSRLPEQLRAKNAEKVVELQDKLVQVEQLKASFKELL